MLFESYCICSQAGRKRTIYSRSIFPLRFCVTQQKSCSYNTLWLPQSFPANRPPFYRNSDMVDSPELKLPNGSSPHTSLYMNTGTGCIRWLQLILVIMAIKQSQVAIYPVIINQTHTSDRVYSLWTVYKLKNTFTTNWIQPGTSGVVYLQRVKDRFKLFSHLAFKKDDDSE